MSEDTKALQRVIGKTVAAVEPTFGGHWDGSNVEDGVELRFTDGTCAEISGFAAQDHGYIVASVHGPDAETDYATDDALHVLACAYVNGMGTVNRELLLANLAYVTKASDALRTLEAALVDAVTQDRLDALSNPGASE